jgi:hypothetical protein
MPNVTDITSLNFFGSDTQFHFTSRTNNGDIGICCTIPSDADQSLGTLHDGDWDPDIWIETDSFSKIFISAILADLGQNSTSNIFTNAALLTTFSKNISNMVDTIETPWLKAGPARTPYEGESTGSLSVNSSVLYTQYLCQVPVLKSTGSLIVSILIADLVFLHAAWALLNWIASTRLKSTTPAANKCAGCVTDGRGMVEMINAPDTSASYKSLLRGRQSVYKRGLSDNSVEY